MSLRPDRWSPPGEAPEGLDDRPHPVLPIDRAPDRTPVAVVAAVVHLEVVPRSGTPWLEVTVDDGTGRLVVVFTGCRHVGGVEKGRRLRIDGVIRPERSRRLVMNPAYQLLAA